MKEMSAALIAPCGMNCRLCMAYQREKKHCDGCSGDPQTLSTHCQKCVIKHCPSIQNNPSGYCYTCHQYPCRRLKQLDARYQKKYKMSMLENLDHIKQYGIDAFVLNETKRWTCENCGSILCVHRTACPICKSSI